MFRYNICFILIYLFDRKGAQSNQDLVPFIILTGSANFCYQNIIWKNFWYYFCWLKSIVLIQYLKRFTINMTKRFVWRMLKFLNGHVKFENCQAKLWASLRFSNFRHLRKKESAVKGAKTRLGAFAFAENLRSFQNCGFRSIKPSKGSTNQGR